MQDEAQAGAAGWPGYLTADGRPIAVPSVSSQMYRHDAVVTQRSTTDPFEIYFAYASVADHLQSRHAGRKQRIFAWMLLVLPRAVVAFTACYLLWGRTPERAFSRWDAGEILFRYGATLFIWAFPIFWIVIIRRGGRRPR